MELIQVRLDDVAHQGYTIGRVDGKVVMVRGGIVGELVTVELTQERASYSKGVVREVIEA